MAEPVLFEPLQPAGKRDWVKPLVGAFVCFLLFRLAFILLEPFVEFFGGRMMGLTLGSLLSAAISSALAMAIFESRKLTDLGLAFRAGSRRNLLTGVLLGIGAALSIVLVPVGFGLAHFQKVSNADVSWPAALFMPVLLFCGAMGEEIAFRGFVMQYLARGWGIWIAVIFTGTVFGLLHGDNPGASWISDLNTVLFGVLFGVGVLRTHELWLPIGLHFGWNLTLPFAGTTLSGLTIRVTGYEWKWNTGDLWSGNLYWSGGPYGPEASILTTAIIGVLLLILWKLPLNREWAWLLDAPFDEPLSVAQAGVPPAP